MELALRSRNVVSVLALTVVTLLAWTSPSRAAEGGAFKLRSVPVESKAIHFDGNGGEWGFAEESFGIDHILSGREKWTGGDDLSFSVDCAHDVEGLLLLVDVEDDVLVRTGPGIPGDDKVAMWFGWEDADGLIKGTTLSIYPSSRSGLTTAVRWEKMDGTVPSPKGILVADGRSSGGWTIEVAIPWKQMPPALRGRPRMLFAVAVYDNDKRGATGYDTVMGTSPVAGTVPDKRGRLVLVEYETLLDGYLRSRAISKESVFWRTSGNVGGGPLPEMVAVTRKGVVFLGADIMSGSGLFHRTIDLKKKEDILEARLCDVDRDKYLELCLRVRESASGVTREVFRILDLVRGSLRVTFAHELNREAGGAAVHNAIKLTGKGAKSRIEISLLTADGFTAETFADAHTGLSAGCHPVLSPWSEAAAKKSKTKALFVPSKGGAFVRKK